jgi:hypothetical protein
MVGECCAEHMNKLRIDIKYKDLALEFIKNHPEKLEFEELQKLLAESNITITSVELAIA